jgi:hypothetical protein
VQAQQWPLEPARGQAQQRSRGLGRVQAQQLPLEPARGPAQQLPLEPGSQSLPPTEEHCYSK